MVGEPREWRRQREQLQRDLWPELQHASPSEIVRIDALRVAEGRPLTSFGAAVEQMLLDSMLAGEWTAPEEAQRPRNPLSMAMDGLLA